MSDLIETEVKIRVSSFAHVRNRLIQLGAAQRGIHHLSDTYVDCPGTVSASIALRVRESVGEQGGDELTLKTSTGADPHVTSRREVNVGLSDAAAMREILSALGFRVSAHIDKVREMFLLADLPVYLDSVEGLGQFVEIGAPVRPEGVSNMRERIREAVQALGLGEHVPASKSYFEMKVESNS